MSRTLSVLASVAAALIMVLVCADVLWRFVVGSSVRGSFEFSEVLLVVLVYLGIAYTQYRDGHVAVDLLTSRLPTRTSHVVQSFGLLVMCGILLWMVVVGMREGLSSMALGESRPGLIRVAVWPVRILIPVAIALLLLETLIDLYDQMRAIIKPQTSAKSIPKIGPPEGL